MSRHTSFKVGGPADMFVTVPDGKGAAAVLYRCREAGIPVFVMGNGSNLLVSDEGIEGVVLKIETTAPPASGGGGRDCLSRRPAGQKALPLCPGSGPVRAGVRLRHPGDGRRRGVHERRRLWRPDGRCAHRRDGGHPDRGDAGRPRLKSWSSDTVTVC